MDPDGAPDSSDEEEGDDWSNDDGDESEDLPGGSNSDEKTPRLKRALALATARKASGSAHNSRILPKAFHRRGSPSCPLPDSSSGLTAAGAGPQLHAESR